jgi:hypothetical protein
MREKWVTENQRTESFWGGNFLLIENLLVFDERHV